MVHIVLVEPEIPQNCGNIARTCAATGCDLHLIRPLDYENLEDFFRRRPEAAEDLWLATTKAPQDYCQARFREGCWLFFGKETAGLPEAFRLAHYDRCIRLPMVSPARSLNLSNSVAVLTYEALRQQGFPGLLHCGEMAD